jgi:tetratricopeptide (TPR) repeat protein
MLNLEEIAQRILQPEISRVEDIDDLKLFSDKYPYCQLFPILYLKALAQHNDIRFEEELTNYAYCISDRSQLYALIHSDKQLSSIEITVSETPQLTIVSEPQTENAEDQSLDGHILPIPQVEVKEMVEEAPVVKIETLVESPSDRPLNQNTIEPSSSPIALEVDDDEEDFESEFISLNIRGNVEAIPEGVETSNEHEPVSLELKENSNFLEEEQSTLESLIEETSITEQATDPVIEKFEREIFSEAIAANYNLDHLVPHSTTEPKEVIKDEIFVPTVSSIAGKKSFSSWLRSNENDEQPKFDEEKERINAIVDQFIKEEPKISRPSKETISEEKPKKEFFSPTKKAKESLDINSMPVSETLAKIFALQGNYPKAIFAYEQLILINPEKKIFFASRIEELKKKLNT